MKTSINYGSKPVPGYGYLKSITITEANVINQGIHDAMTTLGQELVDEIEVIKVSYGDPHSTNHDQIEITIILPKIFHGDESKRQWCDTLPERFKAGDVTKIILKSMGKLLTSKSKEAEKLNKETTDLRNLLVRNTGVAS
jgi:hypothetical protein